MNKLLTCVIMLDTLIVVYIQFVIMLIELEKVLSQELKCLYVGYSESKYRLRISLTHPRDHHFVHVQ